MDSSYQNKLQDKGQIAVNSADGQSTGNKSALQLKDNRPQSLIQKKQVEALANRQAPAIAIQKKANSTGLPDQLKSGIENLSGHSMDDVKVHYNSAKPAQLNAHAYAQGTEIHLASGQEKHLPHEAWHVAQQKQGRVKPTMQMKGKVNVNDDEGLEKEADVMGAKALIKTNVLISDNIRQRVPLNSLAHVKQLKIDTDLFMSKIKETNPSWNRDRKGPVKSLLTMLDKYNAEENMQNLQLILSQQRLLGRKEYKKYGSALAWLDYKLESESFYIQDRDRKEDAKHLQGPITRKWDKKPGKSVQDLHDEQDDDSLNKPSDGYETDSSEDHDDEYAGLAIKSKEWDSLAELDGVDMKRGKIYEDKEGLKFKKDGSDIKDWVNKHLFLEIIKKLNAIHENNSGTVAQQSFKKGDMLPYGLPSLEDLRGIKKVKIRIEGSGDILQKAVEEKMVELNKMYGGKLRFTFKLKARHAKPEGPPQESKVQEIETAK